ncbi:prepilin peptidase [Micromonospora sp. NPDC049559]|uniref:prepilin peptidase n=1 Tax=Micromonospora sp. NPDC049559 TaxID=3155923 RepID=UPI0034299275
MFAAFAITVGAAAGALTPWLAYRLATEPGTPPRSACPRCLRPFPPGLAGWVRPTARCPACPARLAAGPWWAAFAGAGVFGLLALARPADPALPVFLAVAAVGLPLATVDLTCLRLPDPLVATAAITGGAGLAGVALTAGTADQLLRALAAAACCLVGYAVLALLPGSRLGFGDVKLAGVLGLPLGWLGWSPLLVGVALPHLLTGALALALLLTGRAARGTPLPLGPALLAGALFAVALA